MSTQKRVVFLKPPGFEEAANLFVGWQPEAGACQLLYDYEDFKPEAGWMLQTDGKTWKLTAVSGRMISIEECESPQKSAESPPAEAPAEVPAEAAPEESVLPPAEHGRRSRRQQAE